MTSLVFILATLSVHQLPATQTTAPQAQAYRPGQGVTAPVLLRETKPKYTMEAMRAGIQGVVGLECVVMPDGSVGDELA